MTDPFGTAGVRLRVLDAWAASPARFREDANAEEDYAHRSYADRLVIELAQNAADAAVAIGIPGRLHFFTTAQGLYAANTGAPLTAAGVESLSHLRASTKSEGAVGRFGVGFKAVLAVTDAPAVHSRTGGVRWSRAETAALVEARPELAAERSRRDGSVPVMRLPFDAATSTDAVVGRLLAAGYDTVISLPWRDDAAAVLAGELVQGLDPTLLLFLPGLVEFTIESAAGSRTLHAVRDGERVVLDGRHWWVRTASGHVPGDLLAARPVEDRERTGWQVSVALALADDDPVPLPANVARLLRAPQTTDEPLSVAALVAASVPLDTARRHAAAGPLTDYVLDRAGKLFARLLADAPARPELLDLVPSGLPAGQVDAVLRESIDTALAATALFASAYDASLRLRPADAAVIDAGPASGDVTALLSPLLPLLIDPAHLRRHGALVALGVRRLDTADVVDLLGALDQPPAWWAAMITAIGTASDRDALRGLRVPLADGRMAADPRGLLLPVAGVDLAPLVSLGLSLRAVHIGVITEASAEVLRGLGAVDAEAGTLLDDPGLREAVETSLDDDPIADPDELAAAILGLAAQRPQAASERPWLAELALRNSDHELQGAGELLLPAAAGGRLAALMADDAPFGVVSPELVAAYPASALAAVGVLTTFAVVRADDVAATADAASLFLDGEADWLEFLDTGGEATPPLVGEVVAVRDLEWVDPGRWGEALSELAGPDLRPAILEPVRLLLADGRSVDRPSYTRWWLDTHGCVPIGAGHLARPAHLRTADSAPELVGLYDVVPDLAPAAAELVRQLGALTSIQQLIDGGVDGLVELLDRLGDPRREVARHQLRALYGPACTALARFLDTEEIPAIASVRGVVRATAVHTAAPSDAVLIDGPDLLGLVGARPVVPVPLAAAADAAEVLEVPLASELSSYAVRSERASRRLWAELPGFAAVTERLGLAGSTAAHAVAQASYDVHESLRCDDADGIETTVPWRLVAGVPLVSGDQFVQGASRALATLLGCWPMRNAVAAMLAYPERAGELLAEAELD